MWRNISPAPEDFQVVPVVVDPSVDKEAARKKSSTAQDGLNLFSLGAQVRKIIDKVTIGIVCQVYTF